MKVGDKVKCLTPDIMYQQYKIERIRGDRAMLSYLDGFVPNNLRGRWFAISDLRLCKENKYNIGQRIKVIDSYVDGIYRRLKLKTLIGLVGTVDRLHEEDNIIHVLFDNGHKEWVDILGIKEVKERKLPNWF